MKQIKEFERLDKILANNGFGSRSEVKRLLKSGFVTVNGEKAKDCNMHIQLESDQIAVNGVGVKIKKHVYYIMNKKAGYVCSCKPGVRPIVFDLLSEEDLQKRLGGELGIVGRLDVDTEGLLILTTDGILNHQLTSPRFNIPKKYLVHLKDNVNDDEKKKYSEKIAMGIEILPEDKEPAVRCLGGNLEWLGDNLCHITIYDGLYHEVKRIFRTLGNQVIYLKRIMENALFLDESLKPGEYRELTEEELSLLKCGLTNDSL